VKKWLLIFILHHGEEKGKLLLSVEKGRGGGVGLFPSSRKKKGDSRKGQFPSHRSPHVLCKGKKRVTQNLTAMSKNKGERKGCRQRQEGETAITAEKEKERNFTFNFSPERKLLQSLTAGRGRGEEKKAYDLSQKNTERRGGRGRRLISNPCVSCCGGNKGSLPAANDRKRKGGEEPKRAKLVR